MQIPRTIMTDDQKVFFKGEAVLKDGDEKTLESINAALQRPAAPLAESTPEEDEGDQQVAGLGDTRTSTKKAAAKKRSRK